MNARLMGLVKNVDQSPPESIRDRLMFRSNIGPRIRPRSFGLRSSTSGQPSDEGENWQIHGNHDSTNYPA